MTDSPTKQFSDPTDRTEGCILVIDDDEDVLHSLRDLLEMEGGYQVEVANDVDSAISQTDQIKPDLALIDIRLGGDSGLELISSMKNKVPGIDCFPGMQGWRWHPRNSKYRHRSLSR